MAVAFDTLQVFDELKEAFTEEQAHKLSKVIKEAQEIHLEELATKRDLAELKHELKRDLAELELRLKHDLTLRLGGMLAIGIGIVAALVKIL
ncbi:MAG: hypothetical protein AB1797_13745 [bacterium]